MLYSYNMLTMKGLTILLLQFFALASFGQQHFTDASQSDKEATALLDKLKNKVEASAAITISFSLNIDYPGKDTYLTEGSIIQNQALLRIDTEDQLSITNQEGNWVYLKNKNEVQINDVEEGGDPFLNPLQLVSFYETNDFVYAISSKTPIDNGHVYEIEFKPLDNEASYSKIRIQISDSKATTLDNVKIFSKDGTNIQLQINTFDYNTIINDDVFIFNENEFPNVKVEDLRF